MSILRKLMILPPLVAGVALVAFALLQKTPPATVDVGETPTSVRVLDIQPQRFLPRVKGFGMVEPARTWHAVAQVAGRIQEINPAFIRGGTVEGGDVLVRIAPETYELAIAQARSQIESAAAELEQTELSEGTLRSSLEIEREALVIAEWELDRQRGLASRNTVAAATVEAQESAVLAQRAKMQDLENQLALLPSTIKALEQSKAVAEASLAIAMLDLERTVITAPFDGRVAELNVEVSQYVGTGTMIGILDGIAAAEIDVQVTPRQMAGFAGLVFADRPSPRNNRAGQVPDDSGLGATVRVGFPANGKSWAAEVNRISDTVDPETRSIGVIVSVAEPYAQARPGRRPPLIKGMFTEVELAGPVIDDAILLPRQAIRNGEVMIVDDGDRLATVEVDVAYAYEDIAVLESGLEPGMRVVVSDLSPAIPGMLLAPIVDKAIATRLASTAMPEGDAE
ncbi:MAG: efflux RND transporter periplasmic adaptor subunit [Geminicoccaceae bacterium]